MQHMLQNVLCVEFPIEAIGDEGVDVRAGDGNNGPAATTVTTVGTATGNEFFAPEAAGAGATGPGFDQDVNLVDEHRN